mmetsp:Transcript_17840/g.53578  ORF Transcript_17840/g.53578 Transcript_17840/m.53578 type:complete len:805 (+) Transcript_17840:292-2706(+)
MSDLNQVKADLLNVVCASLIRAPRFNSSGPSDQSTADAGGSELVQSSLPSAAAAPSSTSSSSSINQVPEMITMLVQEVAERDPEFVLKLALYVRDDLNIRSTANFLVALASNMDLCSPFLKKYFGKLIRLPSDWLDVAALYQSLPERDLDGRSLPTALRKALSHKFIEFDSYQLGKYSREGKLKRKARKARELARKAEREGRKVQMRPPQRELTMKQMVRQLHISSPTYHVMCILGKKYPADEVSFQRSGLKGTFDPSRAGKRMKLPVPETWETLVSAKGNKASTWEELIDHRKLPFMAMLRNLRNLILTGISQRHHRWVMSRLTNEQTVANSRQFPFAFFSAYEAIDIDLEQLKKDVDEAKEARALALRGKRGGRGATRGAGRGAPPAAAATRGGRGGRGARGGARGGAHGGARGGRGGVTCGGHGAVAPPAGGVAFRRKVLIPARFPDAALLKKYREALDTAVKFATVYNVKPIRGNTVVFCNVSSAMRADCSSATGLGGVRKLHEVGILLGLMCKYMCEECDFRLFGSRSQCSVDLEPGTILDNMQRVIRIADSSDLGDACVFPFSYMEELIRDGTRVDNIIVLADRMLTAENDERLANMLTKYRQSVNPDLLYVTVDLAGRPEMKLRTPSSGGQSEQSAAHPNDVQITGFSAAVLRFIAERGDGNMISYVQHIDDAKGLNKVRPRSAGLSSAGGSSSFWEWLDNKSGAAATVAGGSSLRSSFGSLQSKQKKKKKKAARRCLLPQKQRRSAERPPWSPAWNSCSLRRDDAPNEDGNRQRSRRERPPPRLVSSARVDHCSRD